MTRKIILLFTINLILISCGDNYPKTVSLTDGFWSMRSKYEIDINDFSLFPIEIQKNTEEYLISKIGSERYLKSKFNYGYISSDKPIKNNDNEIDALFNNHLENSDLKKYKYPIYSIGFIFSDLKKGIEKYDLTLILDNNGKILKNINFPKLYNVNDSFIPLDTVHSILYKRKIPKKDLNLFLEYDKIEQATFYYARTLLIEGSILGPSCFSGFKEHFKINAITGEIVEYNSKNTEYYD